MELTSEDVSAILIALEDSIHLSRMDDEIDDETKEKYAARLRTLQRKLAGIDKGEDT